MIVCLEEMDTHKFEAPLTGFFKNTDSISWEGFITLIEIQKKIEQIDGASLSHLQLLHIHPTYHPLIYSGMFCWRVQTHLQLACHQTHGNEIISKAACWEWASHDVLRGYTASDFYLERHWNSQMELFEKTTTLFNNQTRSCNHSGME